MIVCIAEDREAYDVPIQLLILSLARHSPELPIHLVYPPATAEFAAWLEKHPHVTLSREKLAGAYSWNVKPQAILQLFEVGQQDVIWIDSDVIVTRDITPLFADLSADTICTTEESLWGVLRDREHPLWKGYHDAGAMRATMWHLSPKRAMPFPLNTAVLRMTVKHRSLLLRWQHMLQLDEYQRWQVAAFYDRPLHMAGDQDIFSALLASEEFSEIPLRILRRGEDILQFMGLSGFTFRERLRSLFSGLPAFVHAQALKPWTVFRFGPVVDGLPAYIRAVYADTAPYTLIALHYRGEVQGDTSWMDAHYRVSRMFRVVGFNRADLSGLPMAPAIDVARFCIGLASKS